MRLADLQAAYTTPPDDNDMTERAIRPATVADLIAALQEEGAEVQFATTHELWHNGVRRVLEVNHPGRYLVYRIDDGPTPSKH